MMKRAASFCLLIMTVFLASCAGGKQATFSSAPVSVVPPTPVGSNSAPASASMSIPVQTLTPMPTPTHALTPSVTVELTPAPTSAQVPTFVPLEIPVSTAPQFGMDDLFLAGLTPYQSTVSDVIDLYGAPFHEERSISGMSGDRYWYLGYDDLFINARFFGEDERFYDPRFYRVLSIRIRSTNDTQSDFTCPRQVKFGDDILSVAAKFQNDGYDVLQPYYVEHDIYYTYVLYKPEDAQEMAMFPLDYAFDSSWPCPPFGIYSPNFLMYHFLYGDYEYPLDYEYRFALNAQIRFFFNDKGELKEIFLSVDYEEG